MRIRNFLFALGLLLAGVTGAEAQCGGVFSAGNFCGNSGASGALAASATPTAMFDRAFCGTNNSMVARVGGTWGCVGPVTATLGGTGFASYAVGDLLFAGTTTSLSKLPDVATGNAVISGGVGAAPAYGKIGLTTHISGTLAVGNGGTNASSASGTALDNITGFSSTGIMSRTGAGTYSFSTLTALMDSGLCSTRGNVIYRGAASWSCLTNGAAGTVLASGGVGADPTWAVAGTGTVTSATVAAGNGVAVSGTCTITTTGTCTVTAVAPGGGGLRLTLTTGTPVMSSDVTGATTVYCTPYSGSSAPGFVPVYDGTNFSPSAMGGERSQATTDATKSPAAVTTNSNYDIFYWVDAGTPRCTRGPPWTSDTGRGSGAGTTELITVNGIYLNAASITNGPAAQRGTYIGTIRSNGTSTIDMKFGTVASNGGAASFGVWNLWNRILATARVGDTTDSWTLASSSIRAANNSTTMRASFVAGLQEDAYIASYIGGVQNSATAIAAVGVAFDSVTVMCLGGGGSLYNAATGAYTALRGECSGTFLGFHYAQAMEASQISGTQSYLGDGGGPTYQQNMLMLIARY